MGTTGSRRGIGTKTAQAKKIRRRWRRRTRGTNNRYGYFLAGAALAGAGFAPAVAMKLS
jgi:hypothetical protein